MPIRFRCPSCNQMLGIASRKAGGQIECPTCGMTQRVPTKEEAATLTAGDAAQPEAADSSADAMGAPAIVEVLPTPGVASRAPAARHAFDVASAVGKPVPSDMILFRRNTFYVHGLLFLLLAFAGFGLGYLVGRGEARYDIKTEEEAVERQQIELTVKVTSTAEQGDSAGDGEAVVIALPDEKKLGQRFAAQDLRPNAPPLESKATQRLIRGCGGDCGWADEAGDVTLKLPERGAYRVLIVSTRIKRPPKTEIDGPDETEMGKYFIAPERLIGPFKYRWLTQKVDSGSRSIDCNFGEDGK
jgi:phage FluMu protein Com